MRCAAWVGLVLASVAASSAWAGAKLQFDEEFIPRFNVPRMSKPPTIDGKIEPEEWREAVKVMGMIWTGSMDYRDRPVSFWVAWDAKHLYIAARSDILPGHRLYRSKRERYMTGVVHDDSYEFGIFLHDRNKKPDEVSSYLKIVLNSLCSGEYMRLYPSIGQNLFNWRPDMKIASRVYEEGGKQWWDMELAADLDDLLLPAAQKAGDKLDILLAADLKNPAWQWLDVPSASGHLEHLGFPRTILTQDQPYVQVEQLSGLHDKRLDLKSVICNPADQPVKVTAKVRIQQGDGRDARKRPANPADVLNEQQALTIPAHGSMRLDVSKQFPDLTFKSTDNKVERCCVYDCEVTLDGQPDAPPVYSYHLGFAASDKSYLKAVPRDVVFDYELKYNPVKNLLFLSGDTLDAKIPDGSKTAGLAYELARDGKTVTQGRITRLVNYKYVDLLEMPELKSGKYALKLDLVDAAGKPLATRQDIALEKKDEAKEFPDWWGNKIGDTERVLPPFEALQAKEEKLSDGETKALALHCTRRTYFLDGLGLPARILSNGGEVLTAPARLVVKVAGQEHVVAAANKLKTKDRKDWRVRFEGKPVEAAGVKFQTAGWMEQDGLIELTLAFAPAKEPVAIDELRIEWPLDDSDNLHLAAIGEGGNYCARIIDR
ncbi:MAG: glycoside hydrolase domain-containing protein, partial [Planctomycetota bacterium]